MSLASQHLIFTWLESLYALQGQHLLTRQPGIWGRAPGITEVRSLWNRNYSERRRQHWGNALWSVGFDVSALIGWVALVNFLTGFFFIIALWLLPGVRITWHFVNQPSRNNQIQRLSVPIKSL
jgi:hypothetical protein